MRLLEHLKLPMWLALMFHLDSTAVNPLLHVWGKERREAQPHPEGFPRCGASGLFWPLVLMKDADTVGVPVVSFCILAEGRHFNLVGGSSGINTGLQDQRELSGPGWQSCAFLAIPWLLKQSPE